MWSIRGFSRRIQTSVVEFVSDGHQQVHLTVRVTEHTSQELLLVQRMA
jgi:hypothetical protein